MSVWTVIKGKLKKILPATWAYIDGRYRSLEKENKRQAKILQDLLRRSEAQSEAIKELKKYIEQELLRRDDWGKRASEIKRTAEGKPVWVIKCPAPDTAEKIRWGEYAFSLSLKRYLDRLGVYTVIDTREDWGCDEDADVVLVLRGRRFYRPDRRKEHCLYIMWNICHPEMVTKEEFELYDVVCVSSRHYAAILKEQLKVPVFPLLQCTDTELFYPPEEKPEVFENEYIFIGNTRGVARNCVMWAIQDKLPLKIWGTGWKLILGPDKYLVQEKTIENSLIPDLYRSAKATLNDHWKDMLDYQYVNNRIFDALACGLPVISDYCQELKDIFPDAVLCYETKEEFDDCIRRLEEDYDGIKEKVAAQWDMIEKEYSFKKRAEELMEIAEKYGKKQG
ncbi:MAG: glycosyltransferase [Eubacteriales bacterium]|nr:glycosyltransferase [Eubacteriales bacterium]